MSLLFYFDMFGVNKNIKILGKDKYNTKLSSILSILLLVILALKFYKIVFKIISKKSYTIKTTFISDPNTTVNITNFQFSICTLSSDISRYIDWDKNYTVLFAKINLTNSKNSQYFPINKNCDKHNFNDFINKSFFNYDYTKCLCYKIENETFLKQDEEFKGVDYQLLIKTNNQNYKNVKIEINYLDHYFDYEKDNPFIKAINYYTLQLSDFKSIYQELYFNRMTYIDNAYDYEIYEEEGTEKNIYSVSEKNLINQKERDSSDLNFLWICDLKSNNMKIKNEISLFTLDSVYAAFGGFYQLLNLIFSYICTSYNDKCLDNNIFEHFNNEFKHLKTYSTIINSNRDRKDSFEFSRANKSSFINKTTIIKSNNKSKLNNLDILENIYNIYDFKNFIKIHSDINILKKIIISDDYKLFDLVSHYNTYGFIKEDNFFINKDEKISRYLLHIIENIEI